ncbi:S-adenosyl-l-methionine hydroxide adenosyltransferase family protein [Gorillibacterium sp. CAU 1737]|uniref:SAM hydrolase/SAM-dependent halogenase family protein n=1 Tax=Gorillibacterium sp. CAU 1737 TaxID=3140362 RepID=UPI0032617A4C
MLTNVIVFQSDFGLADGAVSAMHGVAISEDPQLKLFDLTHDIPPYNIWEASYRLIQTIDYWPKGTVFVSVVDPGVGSSRRSIAVRTSTGRYLITPDNGTLTHIKRILGIDEVRVIHESSSHLPHSELSYTFHGRDVYAYVGARLAAGHILLEEIGERVPVSSVVELPVLDPVLRNNRIEGTIDVLDVRFGSLWTNVPLELFKKLDIAQGEAVEVCIRSDTRSVYQNRLVYARSFADVRVGESLVYLNSLHYMAVAINQGSFSKAYGIGTGTSWRITFAKADPPSPEKDTTP